MWHKAMSFRALVFNNCHAKLIEVFVPCHSSIRLWDRDDTAPCLCVTKWHFDQVISRSSFPLLDPAAAELPDLDVCFTAHGVLINAILFNALYHGQCPDSLVFANETTGMYYLFCLALHIVTKIGDFSRSRQ